MKMNNKGFTLVEVMAGFSLLVVLMVSFVKIIKISSELTTASVDAKNKTMEFYQKYYSGENYYINKSKNQKAFRDSNDAYSNVEIDIVIEEIDPNNPETPKNTTTLPNVKLKKVENIYDTNLSRISVYRYVREQ